MGAAGDHDLGLPNTQDRVPQRAQVSSYTLDPKGYLVMASDGLGCRTSTEIAGELVATLTSQKLQPDQMAEKLLYGSYQADSKDTITVLVLTGKPEPASML